MTRTHLIAEGAERKAQDLREGLAEVERLLTEAAALEAIETETAAAVS